MDTILIAAGAGLAGLWLWNKSKEKKPAKGASSHPGYKGGGKETSGIEVPSGVSVPKLVPPPAISIPFGAATFATSHKANVFGLGYNPSISKELRDGILIFADQTWLYTDKIKDQYLALAHRLDQLAIGLNLPSYFSGFASYRVQSYNAPDFTVSLQFDPNLPAEFRATLFWQLLAASNLEDNRWKEIVANLESEVMAKYPLFRNSVYYKGAEVLGYPFPLPPAWEKGDLGKAPSQGKAINPHPGKIADFTGPGTIETARGMLYVPKGGSIRGGKAYHKIQAGEWGAQKIAEAWKKENPASWSQAIVSENPGKKWGANGNVFVGTEVNLPADFLDPTDQDPSVKGSYSGSGSVPKPGSSGGKYKPARVNGFPSEYPEVDPQDGYIWVWFYDEDVPADDGSGYWLEVPIKEAPEKGEPECFDEDGEPIDCEDSGDSGDSGDDGDGGLV